MSIICNFGPDYPYYTGDEVEHWYIPCRRYDCKGDLWLLIVNNVVERCKCSTCGYQRKFGEINND